MFASYSDVYRHGATELDAPALLNAFQTAQRAIPQAGETEQDAKRRYRVVCMGERLDGTPTNILVADYDHCQDAVAQRLFTHSCMLPWVLMCGRSHSGGVWAAWRIGPDITPDEVFEAMHGIGELSDVPTLRGERWRLDKASVNRTQLRYIAPCSTAEGTLYYNPAATLFERPTSDRHAAYQRILAHCGGEVQADVAAIMLPSAACPGGLSVSRDGDFYMYRAQVQILGAMGGKKTSLMNSVRRVFEACGARVLRPGSARALEKVIVDSVYDVTATTKAGKPTAWAPKLCAVPVLLMEDENADHVGSSAEYLRGFRRVIRMLADNEISVQDTLETRMPSGYTNHGISVIGAATHEGWARGCKDVNVREGELRRQYFADLGERRVATALGRTRELDLLPLLGMAPVKSTHGLCDRGYHVEVPTDMLLVHEALTRAFGSPALDTRAYQSAVACAFWAHEGECATGMSYESLLCGHAIAARGAACAEEVERRALLIAGCDERGGDGARARIQAKLCADGGGPKNAGSFRKWISRSPLKAMKTAYAELKKEGRIRATRESVEWIEATGEDEPALPPVPTLAPEEAAAALEGYLSSDVVQRTAQSVRTAQDGRRTFMLRVRGALYRRGLWSHPDTIAEFRRLAEYVTLDRARTEALISARLTLEETTTHEIGED